MRRQVIPEGNDSSTNQIVSAVRDIFIEHAVDRLPSEELLTELNAWHTQGKVGRRWSAHSLSRELRLAGIASQNIRIGDRVVKGYKAESFGLTDMERPQRTIKPTRTTKL